MDSLIKNIEKRFARLKSCLKKYHRFPGLEEVHSMRVEIKKIKAFFHLAHFCDKTFHVKKSFLPLRILFRRAQEIREPGVVKTLLDKYDISDTAHLVTTPAGKLAKLQRALQVEMPFFIDMIKGVSRELKKASRHVAMHDVKKYVVRRENKIKEILTNKSTRRELHNCRKMAKEIICISKINKSLRKKLHPFYSNLEIAIGEWHDILMLLQSPQKLDIESVEKLRSALRRDEEHIRDIVSQFYH